MIEFLLLFSLLIQSLFFGFRKITCQPQTQPLPLEHYDILPSLIIIKKDPERNSNMKPNPNLVSKLDLNLFGNSSF